MKIKNLFLAAILVLAMSVAGFSATTQTTLAAAVAISGNQIRVTSANGISASTQNVTTYCYVDGEMVQVTAISSTTLTVIRAVMLTRNATHPSGALVFCGAAGQYPFVDQAQSVGTSCVAANYDPLPLVDFKNNALYNCLNSRWTKWDLTGGGSSLLAVRNPQTAAYTATLNDYIIAYTSLAAAYTVTLPTATGLQGKVYIIKNESAIATNTIWISGTIDGATGTGLYGAPTSTTGVKRIYSDGSSWFSW